MQEGDLIEIDDFSELCDLNPSYCGYEAQGQEKSEENKLDRAVWQWICLYFVQLRIAKVKQTTTNGIDSTL